VSQVDTSFAPSERAALLAEVQDYLPAFLSTAVEEQLSPLEALDNLMNLASADLERVVAVHLALAPPVIDFVEALATSLRHPVTESVRPRVLTQAVRGPIDWGDTIRRRAGAGSDPTLFVVRPARRLFDNPENQALVWTLRELDRILRRARPGEPPDAGRESEQWFGRIVRMRAQLEVARRHIWLHDVAAVRPTSRTLQRLQRSRTKFYKELLTAAFAAIVRYAETPSPEDITDLLTRRYFEPSQDWRLFELVVALRLARGFREELVSERDYLMVGSESPRRPFASFRTRDGATVSLTYQGWPAGLGMSLHREARERHSITAGGSRPDIFILKKKGGELVDSAILELKATRSGGYLGEGLSQLLGYLKERPSAFRQQPAGWLVAPSSQAFQAADAEGRELWVVGAEDVAGAALERFVK
jgi:hypothetical protein